MEFLLKVISRSEHITKKIGEELGKKLTPNDVVALYGELGSGKTVLVKGIAKGLGCKDKVKSPSFVFVHEYQGKVPLYHIDLYRIDKIEDLIALGIDEFFRLDGVCVIEWADKAKGLLPKKCINIKLKILNKNKRKITIY